MTLYEIKEIYLYLLKQIEAGEVPEDAISDTLEAVEGDFNDKADNVACYIKSLQAEADAIKNEMDKLSERMKTKQAKADQLTKYIYSQMVASGIKKIETPRNLLQIKTNPPSVDVVEGFVDWAKENANELLSYKEPTPDKTKIKDALKSSEIPYCAIKQGERLVIK
jgi:hypothetical protein